MGFWVKRLLIMFCVVIGAGLVIVFMPGPALDENGVPIEKPSIQKNMAKFYEEFGMVSDTQIEEKYGENVIPLGEPSVALGDQITSIQRASSSTGQNQNFNWRGSYKARAFGVDSTLMESATGFVKAEGMDLIWHLNQDFIVSHRFLSENTVSGMLNEIAGAIDSNFLATVRVHYCKTQRVMVITDQQDPTLEEICTLVSRRR
jgi:hypothetical protein